MTKAKKLASPASAKKSQPLRLGFVPLTDCAPLVMAETLGLFKKYGLEVALKHELGWATIRDKIIYGELDAAHAVAGMPFAATFGLGSIACDCVTGLVLSLQGNAITLSRQLWDEGVRDARGLREKIIRARGHKTFTFGVVFPFSSHNFLLRQWLASADIHPDRDVRIAVVPPPQMFTNLKAGHLDGYCVGEPWNSIAVHNRVGWCPILSGQLAPQHPEKVLLTRRRFADEHPQENLALIAALLESCAYCDGPENAGHVIETLARPQYLNCPADLLAPSLTGRFDHGFGRIEHQPGFQIFNRCNANEPSPDKAAWILRMMLQSGLIADQSLVRSPAARQIFRPDIFRQAQQLFERANSKPQNAKNQPSLAGG